jgi:hypothetical protein
MPNRIVPTSEVAATIARIMSEKQLGKPIELPEANSDEVPLDQRDVERADALAQRVGGILEKLWNAKDAEG